MGRAGKDLQFTSHANEFGERLQELRNQLGAERVDGGWLFISHAHEDIVQVRKIRNQLEDEGFNPIVFFLKSKTNPLTLNSLIKKEIRARKWFVLVDSPASRESKWVQRELAYVKKLKGKKIITVKLDGDIKAQVARIISNTRVFLSHSSRDRELVYRVRNALLFNDFQVWDASRDIPGVSYYAEEIPSAIRSVRSGGCFLILVTKSTLDSTYCIRELEYAISQHCPIIPILCGVNHLPSPWDFLLLKYQHLQISANPTDQELDRLIDDIIRALEVQT